MSAAKSYRRVTPEVVTAWQWDGTGDTIPSDVFPHLGTEDPKSRWHVWLVDPDPRPDDQVATMREAGLPESFITPKPYLIWLGADGEGMQRLSKGGWAVLNEHGNLEAWGTDFLNEYEPAPESEGIAS